MHLSVRIALILIVLLVVLAGGVVAVVASIDPNRFKADIVRLADEQGGMQLQLNGDIAWRFWPNIGLSVAEVRGDWAGAAASAPLFEVSALALDVRVLPLLSLEPRLQVEGLTLTGARIHLERAAGGAANWERRTASATAAADDSTTPLSARSVGFETLRVEDASLTYIDRSAAGNGAEAPPVKVSNLDIEIGGLGGGRQFPLQVRFDIALDADGSAAVELGGSGSLDGDATRLAFSELVLQVVLRQAGKADLPVELRSALIYELDSGGLTIEEGRLNLAGLTGTFRLQVAGKAAARTYAGVLTVPAQDSAALTALGLADQLPKRVGFDLEFDGDARALRAPRLTLFADDATLAGDAELQFAPRRRLNFALSAASLDLAPLLADAPVADPAAAPPPAPSPSSSPPDLEAPLLPLEMLADVDWDGLLSVDSVRFGEQTVEGLTLASRNSRGAVGIDLKLRQLFGGSLATRIDVDATRADADPTWRLTQQGRGIDASAVPGAFDRRIDLAARIDVDTTLEARGNTRATLGKTVVGKLEFDAGRGRLDVSGLKREAAAIGTLALALRLGGAEPVAAWPDAIDYQQFKGTFTLAGLADQKANVALDNLGLALTGGYDQAGNAIDYDVALTVHKVPAPPTFVVADYLLEVPLPMHCEGPLAGSDSLCGIDRDGVQRTLVAAVRNLAGDRVREKVAEKVPEGLRDAAKGLFDRIRGR